MGPDGTRRFTDASGRFFFADTTDGTYHLQARMLGYAPLDTTITLGPTRSPLVLHIKPVALRLATVPVRANRNRGAVCIATGKPKAATNKVLAAVFDQLDGNVERYNLLREKYPFSYRRVETELIQTTYRDDSIVSRDTVVYDSRVRRPYRVGTIVYHDTGAEGQPEIKMYLPTFGDLDDPAFLEAHCFEYRGEKNNEIRIDFRPADRIDVADIDGSIYLDATKYVIRRAVFHLTKPRTVGKSIIGLTVTTTFAEALPLVPILGVTKTEQPLTPIRSEGVDPHSQGNDLNANLHPLLQRLAVETDTVIDHNFITGPVDNGPVATAPPPPAKPIVIAVGCAMPPSFETIDMPVYGIVSGARPGTASADKLSSGIRRQFRLPPNLDPPVYGFVTASKIAPTLTGQVTFTLAGGRLSGLDLTATSLLAPVDSVLMNAIRRADSAKAFVGVPAGRYTMSLSSVKPGADVLAVDLAHIAVSVVPLAHEASLDTRAPGPFLPTGNGTFEYVVDEQGHVIPTTLRTLNTSSEGFALAVENGITKFRYDPAVSGTCPIKQLVQQPIRARAQNF